MRPHPILAALALATGCAGSPDRPEVARTSAAGPRFSSHEGRPAARRAAGAKSGPTAGDEGDPWWSLLLGCLFPQDDDGSGDP